MLGEVPRKKVDVAQLMGRVKISTEIESNATPHEQFVSMCQFINDYQTKLPNNKSGAIRQGALVFDEKGVY